MSWSSAIPSSARQRRSVVVTEGTPIRVGMDLRK